MSRGKFITEEEIAKIRELDAQGLSGAEIGEKLGRSASAVFNVLNGKTLASQSGSGNKLELAEQKRERLLALLASGPKSMAEIRESLDVGKSGINRQLTKLRNAGRIRLIGKPRSHQARWALTDASSVTGIARPKGRPLRLQGVAVDRKRPRKAASQAPGRGRMLTDDEKAEIVKLYTSGVPGVQVAERIGRGETAIWRYLRQTGLTRGGNRTGQSAGAQPKDTQVAVKSLVLPGKHTNGVASAAKATMLGRGQAFNGLTLWQGQLSSLVARIRKADPGVVSLEVDVQGGHFTVKRNSTDQGEI